MKNVISLFLIVALFFTFCKKKESTPDANTTTSTTGGTTTGGGLSPSTGGDYCNLQTGFIYYNLSGTVTKDSSVFASFYSAPVSSVLPTYVSGGTVTLNGMQIPYVSPSYYITSNPPINITGPLTWSISGSGTVTAFSQSFTPSYPKYAGGNVLPDTCIKSNGITINITGVSNHQNSVIISLYGGSASATKYILTSTGSVTFSSAELSAFPINNQLVIIINLTNLYSSTNNGIKRGFANTLQYTKYSYLK